MKGHVPTPPEIAGKMVKELFDEHPSDDDRILYPGVGDGPFIAAVSRYCHEHDLHMPEGVAVDSAPDLLGEARDRHADKPVEFLEADFLDLNTDDIGQFDYVIGNPPYVPIEGLSEAEKRQYKNNFKTAEQRFDLYILFFEQSLDLLAPDGRLVFITPEKFEYTHTTSELRRLMASYHVERIEHVPENAFSGKVTYPCITTIHDRDATETRVVRRDATEDDVELPRDGSSWASYVRSGDTDTHDYSTGVTLDDVTQRVSCGLATGRDKIFVQDENDVLDQLVEEGWTYPTTSGKQLSINDGPRSGQVIICPYDEHGNLAPEDELGAYGEWAELHRDELESRSCVEKGKVWYSWHENPPMQDLYDVPKILTKDVCEHPEFWADREGTVVPRHSVYYIIPENGVALEDLLEYLNSPKAQAWLEQHSQKAHNDYYRMQSKVLKELPVPSELGEHRQTTLV
ncbi:Eco57I restriction-modification methylase domain-containing protein [Haloarcula litorea]|uniref:Eco57I restriction-modification methylase domain-containing protein n=1 Tax=Haloarcula litorea TaxID=3032579 RepID=UPI0023E8609A|nr:class I SAM-dependent methyltransferase [Halomicroarcula sp. GDY20]